MNKVNTGEIPELSWSSPGGKFAGFGKQLGRHLEVPTALEHGGGFLLFTRA